MCTPPNASLPLSPAGDLEQGGRRRERCARGQGGVGGAKEEEERGRRTEHAEGDLRHEDLLRILRPGAAAGEHGAGPQAEGEGDESGVFKAEAFRG